MGKSDLKNALDAGQKEYLYEKYVKRMTKILRMLEEQAVKGESHRLIEVTVNCLHSLANDARVELGLPFNEKDMYPSVYGENGSLPK